jgi:hypothetical protein
MPVLSIKSALEIEIKLETALLERFKGAGGLV